MGSPETISPGKDLPLAFNQMTSRDLPLATAARAARECGFSGFGVLPSTVAELGVGRVRAVLGHEDLRPTSVCAVTGLIGPDSASAAQRMAAAGRCLEYAAELQVPLIVVAGGPSRALTRRDAWKQAAAALDALLDKATCTGTTILVEPLHPVLVAESVVTSLADGLALIAGHEAAGLVVDTWHVWWDSRLGKCLRDAGRRIGIVHLSDWADSSAADLDRVLPGEGVADLPAICADLLDAGFRGWWEVEVLSGALWAGDQVALIRASYEAATAVLGQALAQAGTGDDQVELTR